MVSSTLPRPLGKSQSRFLDLELNGLTYPFSRAARKNKMITNHVEDTTLGPLVRRPAMLCREDKVYGPMGVDAHLNVNGLTELRVYAAKRSGAGLKTGPVLSHLGAKLLRAL